LHFGFTEQFLCLSLSRKCDSHFTGEDCWSQTFKHFSNQLAQSLVQYGDVLNKLTQSQKLELDTVLTKTYQDFKAGEEIKKFVNDIVTNFDSIFDETVRRVF
jgi:hypothetical protein